MSVAILRENVQLDDDFVVRLQSADLPGLGNSATGGHFLSKCFKHLFTDAILMFQLVSTMNLLQ